MALKWWRRKPDAEVLRQPATSRAGGAAFCKAEGTTPCITVCTPTEGCVCGCAEIRQALEEEIRARGLEVRVGSMKVGCNGTCPYGPLVGFPRSGFYYRGLTPARARQVVSETLENGHLLFDLLYVDPLHSTSGRFLYDYASGFIAVIDDSHCMVQVAKYFLDFDKGVSCGKCTPCRAGFPYLREILETIAQGEGRPQDIQSMATILEAMNQATCCEYAATGSGPVSAILKHFRTEFDFHIEQKLCPSGGCIKLKRA